jgi:hypothetical protein
MNQLWSLFVATRFLFYYTLCVTSDRRKYIHADVFDLLVEEYKVKTLSVRPSETWLPSANCGCTLHFFAADKDSRTVKCLIPHIFEALKRVVITSSPLIDFAVVSWYGAILRRQCLA